MRKLPLTERLRPKKFEDLLGNSPTLKKESWLLRAIENKQYLSILLYGPPGCGKTSFAKLYGNALSKDFVCLNGVDGTIAEIKKIITKIKSQPLIYERAVLFIDEIHRLNKSQQDIFLPYLEDGSITLIAATTENPSFALNNALLSRLRTIKLDPLSEQDMNFLFHQYQSQYKKIDLNDESLKYLIKLSSGDARFFLNCIENLEQLQKEKLTLDDIAQALSKKSGNYDKNGDNHYQFISALHKSIRGSDPDAALYWLARMLNNGEDPKYLIRRLIRMAIEDIGLSDPNALNIGVNAYKSYQILGSPEGDLVIAELAVYLALAPKSNAVYSAFKKALKASDNTNNLAPPNIVVNAANKWMKDEGYGSGYLYDHETEFGFSGQHYFPEEMDSITFYEPREIGFEREMTKRIKYFQNLRKKLKAP